MLITVRYLGTERKLAGKVKGTPLLVDWWIGISVVVTDDEVVADIVDDVDIVAVAVVAFGEEENVGEGG